MASNLPPGVTDSMLPGNTPEDREFEEFCERLDSWLGQAQIECNGDQFDVLACLVWDHISSRTFR